MKQFIVIARDGSDPGAPGRRQTARSSHLTLASRLRESGNLVIGGAMLNPEGGMIGSMMVVQFETEEGLQDWLKSEPYIVGKVWQDIEIKPFRVAAVD